MTLPLIRSAVLAAVFCFSASASHACGSVLFIKTCHVSQSDVASGHANALAGDDTPAAVTSTPSNDSAEEKSKKKNSGKKNKGKKNKGKKNKSKKNNGPNIPNELGPNAPE